jgi:alkylhydroperoxidase/carboxymuconolactone decarboxylase family protein YurZ
VSGHALLQDFADGHLQASLAEGDDRPLIGERSRLPPESERLVRIASLAAVDAPLMLWVAHLADDDAAEIDLDEVAEVLLMVAPIIGGPRIVGAAECALAAARLLEDEEPD